MMVHTYKEIFGTSSKNALPLCTTTLFPRCQNGCHLQCIEMFQTPRRRRFVICMCHCHNVNEGRHDVISPCVQRATQKAA